MHTLKFQQKYFISKLFSPVIMLNVTDSPCSILEAASAGTQPLCAWRSSGWIHRLEWRRRWSRWHRGLRARSRAHYRENTATNTETLHLFWLMTIHWYDAALDWVRLLCFLELLLTWIITIHLYCMKKKTEKKVKESQKFGVEIIFTQKLLLNFTNNYKQMARDTLN